MAARPESERQVITMSSTDAATDRLRSLIAPIVADLQLDLYDLEFRGGTLRVTIDTPAGSPGGVDLDKVALATRLVSRELDHHDPIAGHYTLEVTSPGLERTLRTPAHFQRELGKTVAIRLRDTAGDARRVQGVLVAADDTTATVLLDAPGPDGATERIVRIDQIDRARTVFQWGPTPKPGGPKKGAAKAAKAAAAAAAPTDEAPADEDLDDDLDADDAFDLDDLDLDDSDDLDDDTSSTTHPRKDT